MNAVRRVFDDLDLPSLYSAYEDQTRKHILEIIESMSTDKKDEDFTDPAATKLPRQLFVEILGIFYRRKKWCENNLFSLHFTPWKQGDLPFLPNTMETIIYRWYKSFVFYVYFLQIPIGCGDQALCK